MSRKTQPVTQRIGNRPAESTPVAERQPDGSPVWLPPTVRPFVEHEVSGQLQAGTEETVSQLGTGTLKHAGSPPVRITPGVVLPRRPRTVDTVLSLEKWIGVVEHLEAESFWARVTEEENGQLQELVEFPIRIVSPGDRDLLQVGAIFYWLIGYRESPLGTRENASFIRFRRLPPWDERDLRTATERARRLRDELGWSSDAD